MERLIKYFPSLPQEKLDRFAKLRPLYEEWNAKINVISRKDMDNFYLHHVLHSLAISKVIDFPSGSRILDVGCGGGFPGIPLAIMFPECQFVLCDSIAKKIKVAEAVARELALNNVTVFNGRAETVKGRFDYVVSRAVTDLSAFYPWVKDKFDHAIVSLKGGNLEEEIAACASKCRIDKNRFLCLEIAGIFDEEWFAEKKIVIISR